MKFHHSLFLLSFSASLASAAWPQSSGQEYVTTESWEIRFEDYPSTTTSKYVKLTPELLEKLQQLKGQGNTGTGGRQPIDQVNPSRQDQGQQRNPQPPTDWKAHGDSIEIPLAHGWGSSGWKPRDEDGGSSGSGGNRWGSGKGWQPRDADPGSSDSGSGSSNRWGGSWKGGSGGETGGAGSGSGSGSNKWGGSWPAK